MLKLEPSPAEWLSSWTILRLPRERMQLRRSFTEASFEGLDVSRELLGEERVLPKRARRAPAAAVPPITLGPYKIQQIGERVELRLGNVVRWVADAAAFGGAPEITLQSAPGAASINLSNAFYPGTTIPADT